MTLNEDVKKLISLIMDNDYKAYAVGGYVRDNIMNKTPGDIDITTSAKPYELEKILDDNNIRYIETGLKHGTITVLINNQPYEVTTFRTEGGYMDNRHPDSVSFVTDIRDDLARRDFTINAMAYNDAEGVIDEFGGIRDIENGIIRCVGDADRRFKEDALRIMRAIRFASVLGFNIEETTKKAIFDNIHLLKNISAERIYIELVKLLLGDNVKNVLLEYRDVISVIIPEMRACFDYPQNTKWHIYDVYRHIVESVAVSPKKDYMRLALLLHDIAKPYCHTVDSRGVDHFKGHTSLGAEIAGKVLKRLRVSNDIFGRVTQLIYYHDDYIYDNDYSVKAWLNILDFERTLDFIDIKIADLSSHNLIYSQCEIDTLCLIKQRVHHVVQSGQPYKLSHLAIKGGDLVKLGYTGEDISREFNRLLRYVMRNPDDNQKQLLISKAIKDKKEK